MPWEDESTSKNDDQTSVGTEDNVVVDNDCGYLGIGRPGSFVSHRPGAYGRLLLAVYVRWKTGLLVSSDWFRPVTWALGGRSFRTRGAIRTQYTVRSGPAD